MSATTWLIISVAGFSLAAVAIIAAVIMFFKMDIPAIIGDLSGKTAAREVKAMREGDKSKDGFKYKLPVNNAPQPNIVNNMSSSDIKKVHASKRLDKPAQQSVNETSPAKDTRYNAPIDSPQHSFDENATAVLRDENATAVLRDDMATEVLSTASDTSKATEVLTVANATAVLSDAEATAVLTDNTAVHSMEQFGTEVLADGTTVLSGTTVLTQNQNDTGRQVEAVSFELVRNVVLIHSDEVI